MWYELWIFYLKYNRRLLMEKIIKVIQATIPDLVSQNLVHSNRYLNVTNLILIFQADCYHGARNTILNYLQGSVTQKKAPWIRCRLVFEFLPTHYSCSLDTG